MRNFALFKFPRNIVLLNILEIKLVSRLTEYIYVHHNVEDQYASSTKYIFVKHIWPQQILRALSSLKSIISNM